MALAVDLAMIVAGFAALAGLLTPAGRRLLRIEHGLRTVCRVVLGTPAEDGIPAQQGVIERLDGQDEHLRQQDGHLGTQDARLKRIEERLDALHNHLRGGGIE